MKFSRLIGAFGSIVSFLFCGYILLFNPYTHSSVEPDVFISFTIMYLLPVLLAFYANISLKPKLMIICSIWALPLSIYCLATPGIFKWLIFGPILILIAGIRMFKNKRMN